MPLPPMAMSSRTGYFRASHYSSPHMGQTVQAHCREKAFYAFGTARIFERRMRKLDRLRAWITYLGILVPLLVGTAVLSFGTAWVAYAVIPASVLGCAQIALSAWSLVARWDEKHSYAIAAMQAQTRLFNAWDSLAKRTPADLDTRANDLDAEDLRQEQSDLAQNISPQEKRYAMRASLYHFGNQCVRCKSVPKSMKPSDCDTCGNF